MLTLKSAGLDSVREVARLPRMPEGLTNEERHELLLAKDALHDDLIEYTYAFDAGDVDAIMSCFDDDCVLVNPRGRYVGAADIRRNYDAIFRRWWPRHLWTNIAIRFPERVDEAYVTAYHFGILNFPDRTITAFGPDIMRFTRKDGAWRIVERWIGEDVSLEVPRLDGPVEAPGTL